MKSNEFTKWKTKIEENMGEACRCPVCGEFIKTEPNIKKKLFGFKLCDIKEHKQCRCCKSSFNVFFRAFKKSYQNPVFSHIQRAETVINIAEVNRSLNKDYDLYVFKVKDCTTLLFGKRHVPDIEAPLIEEAMADFFYVERGDGTKYKYSISEIAWAIKIASIRPLKLETEIQKSD